MDLNCEHIDATVADGILTVSIRRPDKKNALTTAMYNALNEAARQAAARDDVRVMLIRGSDDCFTAGNDLDDFRARAQDTSPLTKSAGLTFITSLSELDKPVVAEVSGLAIGIGVTMLLHCDFVYVGESARLRTPFVDLGLCPEAASSLLLPLIAGPRRAAQMLLAGETLSAGEAVACGLATASCSDAELTAKVRTVAEQLAAKPVDALMTSKRLIKGAWAEQVRRAIEVEGEQFGRLLRSEDCQAILASFFTRKPA